MKDDFNNVDNVNETVVNDNDKKSDIENVAEESCEKTAVSDEEKAGEVIINVIEDEPYEDLSAFYNVNDIGILDSEDDEVVVKKPKKAGKIIAAVLGLILVVAAGIGVYFGFIRDNNTYYTLYDRDKVYSNGTIEVEFEQLNILDSLLTYELDEDYVYVALVYNFKNVSSETLDWTSTPYMSMKPYIYVEDKGYLPMEAESEEALALINLLSEDIKNEISSDNASDIIADADTPDANDDVIDTNSDVNTATDGTTDGNVTDETAEVEPEIVELENNVLYGNFDFGALQIFALDYGVDFSTVKDDLAPGDVRQSADIFKIRKELFDNNIFFIGADNLDAIFRIDLTPVDTLKLNTSTDTQTDTAE